ncbi:hypothetical protein B0I37DRAFT_157573 [Chaetomium sp. MPI-CAGE-AT-0009]|nr:hypothetical protein B0I37DRAFT_157573 [Chaetomium sp. MPI-CAGE-AT-0009]
MGARDMHAGLCCPENDGRRVFPPGCCLRFPVGVPWKCALCPQCAQCRRTESAGMKGLHQDALRRFRWGGKEGRLNGPNPLTKKYRVHSLRDSTLEVSWILTAPLFGHIAATRAEGSCQRSAFGANRDLEGASHICHAMLPVSAPDRRPGDHPRIGQGVPQARQEAPQFALLMRRPHCDANDFGPPARHSLINSHLIKAISPKPTFHEPALKVATAIHNFLATHQTHSSLPANLSISLAQA